MAQVNKSQILPSGRSGTILGHIRLQSVTLATLVLVLQATAACRSELKYNGQDVKDNLKKAAVKEPSPFGIPVTIPEGLATERTYFQSRSPITLSIKPEAVSLGDDFSLYNDTTKAALVTSQSVALTDAFDSFPQGLGFAEWGEAALGAYELTLTLYPLDPKLAGKLSSGTNSLRLAVGEGTATPKQALLTFERHDSSLFALSGSAFSQRMQLSEGLEAEVSPWHQSAVTNGKTLLTVGLIPLLSR